MKSVVFHSAEGTEGAGEVKEKKEGKKKSTPSKTVLGVQWNERRFDLNPTTGSALDYTWKRCRWGWAEAKETLWTNKQNNRHSFQVCKVVIERCHA